MKLVKNILKKQRDHAWEENKKNILKILNEIKLPKDPILLDLGCDDGMWTIDVAKAAGTKKIIGIEIVKKRGRLAEEKGIDVIYSDLGKNLPLSDSSVDLIHANQVIEHLTNTDKFTSEISRVLKTGGFAVISTEILSSWHNIFALSLGFNPFSLTNISSNKASIGNPLAFHSGDQFEWPGTSWQHQRIFTIRTIKELFWSFELKPVRILTSGYYPIGTWFSRFDKRHSAFMVILFRKEPRNKIDNNS